MNKKKTNEEFIEKSKLIHGDKYDYSLVEYNGYDQKVKIICSIHGVFGQISSIHRGGGGCKKCANEKLSRIKKKNTESFIENAKKVHGNKYDYSLVDYKHSQKNIKIICPIHGVFEQKACNHLSGLNCTKCNKFYKLTTESFIDKCNKIYNNKYDYSLANYIDSRSKIKIICPEHGVFEQCSGNHLRGFECMKCSINKRKITLNKFIEMSNEFHKNKYDYSLVEYINFDIKIKIICPIHGIFNQNPSNHVGGQGCPICKESRGEKRIREFLNQNKIEYICQKSFQKCKHKNVLKFDFYLPNYNTCIEYDGRQHFYINEFFGGIDEFKKVKIRDQIKNEYCKINNIYLIRIRYDENIEEKLNNFKR